MENGTAFTPTTPQTSSTTSPEVYDPGEHDRHLRCTYGIIGVYQVEESEDEE